MPILTPDDGMVAKTPEEAQSYQAAGYQQCFGKKARGNTPCTFQISPEAQSHVTNNGGYYTCPNCKESHDLLSELPWHGSQNREDFEKDFSAGGGTRIGLDPKSQGDIGEALVKQLGELPGYGPIVWHSEVYNSPLDMATKEWGIEVKTLGYDAIHHRFIPGRPHEKQEKNSMSLARGYKGVLGVLVLLNYRTSKADIYAKEYPVDPVTGKGVGAFRSYGAPHLLAEVPFKNPYMQPDHPAPISATSPVPPPTGDFLGVDDEIPF